MRTITKTIASFFASLFGIIVSIVKNLIWVGYAAGEALLFMWVFNYMVPKFPEWGWNFLPTVEILYLESLCLFLLIGFISNWIKKLIPTLVKIEQKNA
jgi:hypothetical protein